MDDDERVGTMCDVTVEDIDKSCYLLNQFTLMYLRAQIAMVQFT